MHGGPNFVAFKTPSQGATGAGDYLDLHQKIHFNNTFGYELYCPNYYKLTLKR